MARRVEGMAEVFSRQPSRGILIALVERPRGFNSLKRKLRLRSPETSRALKILIRCGLVELKVKGPDGPGFEYGLTDKGRRLMTICAPALDWTPERPIGPTRQRRQKEAVGLDAPVLAILGYLWSGPILLTLSRGPLRFNGLRGALDRPINKVIAGTLRRLVLNQLIARHAHNQQHVEYELTPAGRRLLPVVRSIHDLLER